MPEGGAEIHVWYAEELPSLFWGEYDYLMKIPGMSLKIVIANMERQDFGIIVNEVLKTTVNQSVFLIPEDYILSDFYMNIKEDVQEPEAIKGMD